MSARPRKWEYDLLRISYEDKLTVEDINAHFLEQINRVGKEGWEAWHVHATGNNALVFLKRPIYAK